MAESDHDIPELNRLKLHVALKLNNREDIAYYGRLMQYGTSIEDQLCNASRLALERRFGLARDISKDLLFKYRS